MFKFSVYFPEQEVLHAIGDAERSVNEAIPSLVKAIGIYLLGKIQINYKQMARGGAGADGTSWRPLAPSTLKRKGGRSEIGVDTGLQLASASPGFLGSDGRGGNIFEVSGDVLVIGFGRNYSRYFDEARPLIPEQLPQAWVDEIDGMVNQTIGRVTRGLFDA
jgi:hypothetical protein